MKKAMKQKKAITGACNVGFKAKAEHAERKITIMVMLTGFTAIIAHIPQMLYSLTSVIAPDRDRGFDVPQPRLCQRQETLARGPI